ncbi:PGF-pre-PGF domain-containing protein [Methanomethylovorans sp.]|uniref:PGF-pre-PGF domain-containing protein n=1 Tax=Methanomethylovorans sp. TaxID=2758717 RepID=UPI00351C1ABF
MQLKLSESIYFGVAVFFMLMITGISAAEELKVDFVSQYSENMYDAPSITNAILTQGEDFVSHRGGSISNVVVNGNYAYIGQGQDLLVADISNVSNPIEMGRVTTQSIVNNVVISGNYAYVADGQNGLVIVDITNPAAPAIVGAYSSVGAGVALSGNYAYLASGTRGLVAVDITNPTAPTPVGSYNTSGVASKVAISGNYAYVADDNNGLVVVNIANPAVLTPVGGYDTAGTASDVFLSGNYAYIADGNSGLEIIDITDPATPVLVGTYDTAGFATDVTVAGNYAYVADGTNGMAIIDITNPAAPASAGSHNIASAHAYCVDVAGSYAYVAYGRSGLSVLDITNPAAPTSVGTYTTTAGFANGIAVSGNYAYVANGYMGLMKVDITNPAAPASAGSYITPGYAHDVALSGNDAYIADGRSGLLIIDTTALTLKGRYSDTIDQAFGVAVVGNYAYIAYNSSGLAIVDVANPVAPVAVSGYDTAGNAENVAVAGNYAYIADGDNGLVILDITNPATPTLVGSYDTAGHAYAVEISGRYAYVADGSNGIIILDVANPAVPTLIGSYDTNFAQDIALSGNYAYIADDSNGLVILDITNPTALINEGSYNTAGYAYSVAVAGNYAYVADFGNGLVILHVEGAADTIPPASVTNLKETIADPSWIRWTWTNPIDTDFKDVIVYIDGAFVTNTSEGYYNLTGLIEGSEHTISTKTVDTSGNINPAWTNDSATATTFVIDTIPPASVTNLAESDSDSDWISWTWENPIDADFSYVMVYIDGVFVINTADSSINSYNATGLSEGTTYTIGISTVDSSGNINSTLINDSAIAMKLPEIFSVSGADITRNSITVTWEASNDTAQVQLSRDDVILGNVNGSSYADSNLSSGKTYTYTLIPYNNNGLAGKAVSADLKTKSSSGGGGGSSSSKSSSSGGGGSGAASVEDYTNLAVKDANTQFLQMNETVTYLFTKEGNPIQSISLYSLKNSGQITSTIEVLNNRSKLVNSTPEGSIYKYVNIWVGKAGFATSDNIKDAQVKFKVNNSWMEEEGISTDDVRLQRYNGTAWEELPTAMENSAESDVMFESHTSGFSHFAITAEKILESPISSEDTQSDIISDADSNLTPPAEEPKTPGFETIFAVAGLLAVVYLARRN